MMNNFHILYYKCKKLILNYPYPLKTENEFNLNVSSPKGLQGCNTVVFVKIVTTLKK